MYIVLNSEADVTLYCQGDQLVTVDVYIWTQKFKDFF